MSLTDKILYHQIHPFKLGTDILFAIISLYFFWQRQLVVALVLHFAPPIFASALVISLADLTVQERSTLGRYVKKTMTHTIEAIRLFGDTVTVLGAWYHSVAAIIIGLVIVLAAWLSGFHKSPAVRR